MDPGLVVGEGALRGPSGLRIRCAAGTHPGRVRERNEDACGAFLPSPDLPLPVDAALVVSDGVGGHEGGQEASRFTVDAVRDTLASLPAPPERPGDLLDALLQGIHRELLRQAEARGMRSGMGATVTLALVQADELFLAQVGDSRGYRLRDDELTQLTRDDSWVAERERLAPGAAVEAGEPIGRNVLTQCLGIGAALRVQVVPVTMKGGDRYLLCSDGLHGPVPDAEIREVLRRVADPARAVEMLLARANAAGGPDNIAAVVFDVGPPFPAEAHPVAGAGATLPGGVRAVAATASRSSRPTGTLLVGVGALLLVAGSAAGYRGVSRAALPAVGVPPGAVSSVPASPAVPATPGPFVAPDTPAGPDTLANRDTLRLPATPGAPDTLVPEAPLPDTLAVPASLSAPDTRSNPGGRPVPDTLSRSESPTAREPIPGDTVPFSPDSIADGADSVPTLPSGGASTQE